MLRIAEHATHNHSRDGGGTGVLLCVCMLISVFSRARSLSEFAHVYGDEKLGDDVVGSLKRQQL